jgi:FtsP/CotA-like multicopper oxidase with cupredoxin domain
LNPVKPDDLIIRAAVGTTDVGNGVQDTAWLLNDSLPSPLIRVRKGEIFKVQLQNELPDQLILHWHGLTPPELMDGHPRLAISKGLAYDYEFTVENRASTYWYHSHSHYKVGKHAYFGIAGMLIVDDDETDDLKLPSGKYEIPLVLQDRRVDYSGTIIPYTVPDTMEGLIGNESFGNGINRPELKVDTAIYRFRILNGSNARIFRLARNDNKQLLIIGNDTGLLEKTMPVEYVDIAPGERIDMLIDLRDASVGDEVLLGSRGFFVSQGLAKFDDLNRQGHPMDLMRLHVTTKVRDRTKLPETLLPSGGPNPADSVNERFFKLTSNRDGSTRTMMQHQINGKTFQQGRIDETVPFGQTEIWTIKNENNFSHPMHLHGTHFRILSRTGGRGKVMPWEGGLKDTVLLHPEEEVKIAVKFEAHPGLFLLHCHNLEHEDIGMMLNIMVEA